jgi:hypothetical protein
MDPAIPENFTLITKLKKESINAGLLEGFLESAPQFILQNYIVLKTGSIGIMIAFSLARLDRLG